MSALALRRGFALGSHPTYRFCRNVLSSVHACCLTHSAKQDGLRYLAFLFRRVEIAIRAFSRRWCGYLPLLVHFGFVRLFVAIPTGIPGTRGTRNGVRENGAGGAAFVRFCAIALALQFFPRGVRWGLRAPKPAPKSLRLSGLSSRCGGAALVQIRCAVTRAHG